MFRTENYDFSFPKELIAYYPPEKREMARLLVLLSRGKLLHMLFQDLPLFLKKNDVLVLNNTEVIKARLKVKKASGGKVELLLIRRKNKNLWEAIYRGRLKEGNLLFTDRGRTLNVSGFTRENTVVLEGEDMERLIDEEGEIPLPPYIKREPQEEDIKNYQTVYAREKGSAAAPTAGLHFSKELLEEIKECGVDIAEITLHVSWDTFRPIKERDIRKHRLHGEYCRVDEEAVEKIRRAKRNGGRVIACGTTVVRALETAGLSGKLKPFEGITYLYIYPPFKFQVVDLLITNFHFPRSTLLVLVSAFAGRREILTAYRTAIEKGYRLFSYGDAMLLFRKR